MDAILEIAKRHLLLVIEDACQAHGARYAGTRVGGFGYAAAFSFYPGKNLGAYGEGGALTTNNDEVAALARSLRSHGESTRYLHKYVGYNYRMDGFQGAVLNVKMKYLEQWTAKRQSCAELYRRLLQGAKVRLPENPAGAECVYHLFVAYVENRDQVRAGWRNLEFRRQSTIRNRCICRKPFRILSAGRTNICHSPSAPANRCSACRCFRK